MGRMADARKRAKRATEAPPEEAARPASADGTPAADLVFDDEAPAAAAAAPAAEPPAVGLEPAASAGTSPVVKIELPASGLAEDILARHEATLAQAPAAQAAPEAEPAAPTPAPATAPETAPFTGHSLSFFAAPAQDRRSAIEATEHLVTFYLDREEYGVDVRQVQEIRRVGEITSVPRAPEFVRGVINLRGRILPVLDLKRKLALGEVAATRSARIVVVRVRERLLGLLVDGASQVPKIPVSRIEAAPEEVVERGGDYIRGVAKLDDRLIILVDLERLLAFELRAAVAPARAETGPSGVS